MDLAIPIDVNSEVVDKYSPLMDTHHVQVRRLQREIAKRCVDMRPLHVDIAKLVHAGKSYREAAAELDKSERTVTKTMQRPDVKELLFYLNLLRETIDGPNKTQRLHMLWRIAVDNEKTAPKIATCALAEINKMTGTYGKGDGGGLTVVINNNILGRGPLD